MKIKYIVTQLALVIAALSSTTLLADDLNYTSSLAPEEEDFLRGIYAKVGGTIQEELKVDPDMFPLPEYREETKYVRKFMIANYSGVFSVFIHRIETSPEEAIRGIEQLIYSKETSLIAWEMILRHAPYYLKDLPDKDKRFALKALIESLRGNTNFFGDFQDDKILTEYKNAALLMQLSVRTSHIILRSPYYLGKESLEVLVELGKEKPAYFQETILDSLVISPVSSKEAQDYICDRIVCANDDQTRKRALACLANHSHQSIRTRDLLVSILVGEQKTLPVSDFDIKKSAASVLTKYAGVSVIYALEPYLHEANEEELELITFVWGNFPFEESELDLMNLALSEIPVIRDTAKKALELHSDAEE